MRNFSRKDRALITSLGLACLGLQILLTWQIINPPVPGTPGDEQSAMNPDTPYLSDGQQPVHLPQLATLGHYDEIVERTLFSQSRRPPPVHKNVVPQKPPAPVVTVSKNLVLLGIVLTADKREAIFQDKKTGSVIRATEGGTVAGWVLKELHPDRVLLQHDKDRSEIILRPSSSDNKPARH